MDPRTGKIQMFPEGEIPKGFVPVDASDMTEKQNRENVVSLYDHRSKLGKKLTAARAKAGITRNRYRKLKRKRMLR